jgi:tripartite-type tricarboxylate transporter receptor subunit TctC
VRDFAAISFLATGPLVIVAHPSLPAKNMKELIALARQRPGQLNYGSTGVGSVNHLLGEMVQMFAGVRLTHVPYKGGGDAIAALLTGDVALVMTGVPAVMPLVRAGRVRTIVGTGPRRTAELPDVQTMAEAGLKNAEFLIWYGLVAPVATPRIIIDKLNREVVNAMAGPAVAERFRQQGVMPQTNTPQQFAQVIREDFARWSKIIRAADIRLD